MNNGLQHHVPPHNEDAERAVIGGLMLEPEAWDQIVDILDGSEFYFHAHSTIFSAIRDLFNKNHPIDIITVTNHLTMIKQLDVIGGPGYLAEILSQTISSAHITSYAQIVRDKSVLRMLINSTSKIIERAYDQDFEDVGHFIDEAEAEIYKLANKNQTKGLVGSSEVVKRSLEKIEELYARKSEVTGLATGFYDLDRMTAGLHSGELIIVAARPSMGKTAFSLNIAQHISVSLKKNVAYFSLEMDKESVMMRLLAAQAKVNMGDIRTGRIVDSAWPRLINAAAVMSDAQLFIDDTSGISPLEIRAKARRLKAQHGLDCIMVDYLQIMDLKQKVESRERQVSEISRLLKSIARELEVPVIALSQLNRGVEGRTDRRPMLSDLRESGSIEQDADVIMMLFREGYYDKDTPEVQNQAEVIIGKQRNGPTGNVKLAWRAQYGVFEDFKPSDESVAQAPNSGGPQPPPSGPSQEQRGPRRPFNFAPGAGAP